MASETDTLAPLQDPAAYLERVYAGVLGKLIGVYLGRPFEGWTYQRIMKELGTIEYYVHDRLGVPLVVTDDDVSGTFTFVRALAEHGCTAELTAEQIGKTWLNMIVERRSILWWGGNGVSTEHTAWINLKRGIPAPRSGSIAVNGKTVAEQIGAQIFIDGWALVAPGQPHLAAKLAEAAGRVSHDGEAVHAAKLIAAMEAKAFITADVDALLDCGLSFVPAGSKIARLIADVRAWRAELPDWRDARARVEQRYGYDKYLGNCHVVPNHALIVLALLYADGDFDTAMTIVNTSGWDTDCNSGNVGCLFGIMNGLKGLSGRDWRGPIADRTLISSADGGYAINDAATLALDVANLGLRLAGRAPIAPPKAGAQFHFALPGSVQGFAAVVDDARPGGLDLAQGAGVSGPALKMAYKRLGHDEAVAALTPAFAPQNVTAMRTYDLQAAPRLYSGQRLYARVLADVGNVAQVECALCLRAYGAEDVLIDFDGPGATLAPGGEAALEWVVPDLDGQPIESVGVRLRLAGAPADGVVWLDRLGWDGTPSITFKKPSAGGIFWRRAWVNGVSAFGESWTTNFRIAQDSGVGVLLSGTREWRDYRLSSAVTVHLGASAGLAARVQGLRRYTALLLEAGGVLRLVKVRDELRTVLAEAPFAWELDRSYVFTLSVKGAAIEGTVDGVTIRATDTGAEAYENGGIGLVIDSGALSTDAIDVGPVAG